MAIQRTQQLMAGEGKTPADIDYLTGMVYRGEKTLASLTTAQEIAVRKKLETPISEWLVEKGYPTNVSFLPTSKVAKEWQAEVKKALVLPTEVEQRKIDAKLLQEKIKDAVDSTELYRQIINDPDIPVEIRNLLTPP